MLFGMREGDRFIDATKGSITNRDLEVAVEEGFLQRAFYPGVKVELAELTPIIVP